MKKKINEDYRAISLWWAGDEEKLNTQQLQVYARIDFADNMIRKYGAGKKTAEKIYKKFKVDYPKYSVRQAYIDMDWAVELMNSMSRKAKEMDKLYAIDILKKQIRNVQKTVVDQEKQAMVIARLLKELRETTGYHLPDIDLPDFSDMGGNTYRVTTDPEEVGMRKVVITEEIMRKYEMPKARLFEKLEDEAEDVEFEETDE